jgi:hypothetical protein
MIDETLYRTEQGQVKKHQSIIRMLISLRFAFDIKHAGGLWNSLNSLLNALPSISESLPYTKNN